MAGKIIVFVVSLLFCVNCLAREAGKNVVMLGHPDTVDLVMAELSNDRRITFLERKEIEKILQEHKLKVTSHAPEQLNKYFPHADLFVIISTVGDAKNNSPSGLLIFDAKNSFRLHDSALPRELEKAAGESSKFLLAALDKQSSAKTHRLAISVVRDLTTSDASRKYASARLAAMLERRLGESPDIQVLEREYLENIVAERRLTEQQYPLGASAILLVLEFTYVPKPETTNLTLSLYTTDNKLLQTFNYPDCNDSIEGTLDKLTSDIGKYLNTTVSQENIDSKSEAARFFAEYKSLRSLGLSRHEASRKLYAALALDGRHADYRREEMVYHAMELGKMPWDKRLDTLWKHLQSMKEFVQEYPDDDVLHTSIGDSTFIENLNRATPLERERLVQYCDAYRKFHFERCGKGYKFSWDKELNTIEEAQKMVQFVSYHLDYYLYCNPDRWFDVKLELFDIVVKKTEDLAARKPELRKDIEFHLRTFAVPTKALLLVNNSPVHQETRDISAIMRYLDKLKKYKEPWQNSCFGVVRLAGYDIEAIEKMLQSNRSEKEISRCLQNWLAQIYKGTPDLFDEPEDLRQIRLYDMSEMNDVLSIVFKVKSPGKLLEQNMTEFRKSIDKSPDFQQLYALLSTLNEKGYDPPLTDDEIETLHQYAPLMKKHYYRALYNYDIRSVYNRINRKIFEQTNRGGKRAGELLALLNSDFTIRRTPVGSRNGAKSIALTQDNDRYYLLLEETANRIKLCSLNLAGGVGIRELTTIPLSDREISDQLWSYMMNSPTEVAFAASGNLVAVALKNKLALYNLESGQWNVFDNLPAEIRAIAFLNGRIYCLCGPDPFSDALRGLFSMLPDGTDIQLHFWSARTSKTQELDHLTAGLMNYILPLKDGKHLLFGISSRAAGRDNVQQRGMYCFSYVNTHAGIYVFNTETGESRKIHALKDTANAFIKRHDGKVLVITNSGSGDDYYEISEPDLTVNLVYSRREANKKLLEEGKLKFFIPKSFKHRDPQYNFVIRDAVHWSAGYRNFINYYNLEKPEATPFLYLGETIGLFTAGERIIFVGSNYISEVTLNK